MIPQLLQPPRHILESLMLGEVVDEEGADSATVVGRGDGPVSLLTCRVPDLGLDGLVVDLDATGGKFDADGGLAVEIELVACESREQVGLSNTRVSYQDHLEKELRRAVSVSSILCEDAFCSIRNIHRTRRSPWWIKGCC